MTRRTREALLWLALLAASSPTIGSLAQALVEEPAQRYVLHPLFLLVLLALSGDLGGMQNRNRPRLGALLLGLGTVSQLVGLATSSRFIAHVGLPTSMLGLGLLLGRPKPAAMLLAFAIVPVPGFVYAWGSPSVELALAHASATLLGPLGLGVEARGSVLVAHGLRLEIVSTDIGIATAICSAAWAADRALRESAAAHTVVARSLAGAAIGLLAQPLLVALAAVSLASGRPELGRLTLAYGVPVGLSVLALSSRHRRIT